MKFDVIIGNPPYQESDGGGRGDSSKPVYNHFIDESKKISDILMMILPSRWYAGGEKDWIILEAKCLTTNR